VEKEMHKTLSEFKRRYNNQMRQQKEKYKALMKQAEETNNYFNHHNKSPS
jgi:CRISPR/Cas system CMR subunit Cmr6 (Cas7 group RAMP superfamily)